MAAWRTPRIPSFADPHRGVQLCESARPIVHCLAAPARERGGRGSGSGSPGNAPRYLDNYDRGALAGWLKARFARCFCVGKTGTFETRAEVLLYEEVANRLVAILSPRGMIFVSTCDVRSIEMGSQSVILRTFKSRGMKIKSKFIS